MEWQDFTGDFYLFSCFTDEETDTERLNSLPKVTKQPNHWVQSYSSWLSSAPAIFPGRSHSPAGLHSALCPPGFAWAKLHRRHCRFVSPSLAQDEIRWSLFFLFHSAKSNHTHFLCTKPAHQLSAPIKECEMWLIQSLQSGGHGEQWAGHAGRRSPQWSWPCCLPWPLPLPPDGHCAFFTSALSPLWVPGVPELYLALPPSLSTGSSVLNLCPLIN